MTLTVSLIAPSYDILTISTAGIYHRPTPAETLRRIQSIFHELHISHLASSLVHFRPHTKRRVCDPAHRPTTVFESPEHGHIDTILVLRAMYVGLYGVCPGEYCVYVEGQDFPKGVDVDKGFMDCGRPGF